MTLHCPPALTQPCIARHQCNSLKSSKWQVKKGEISAFSALLPHLFWGFLYCKQPEYYCHLQQSLRPLLSHKPSADISTDHTNKPLGFITTDTNNTGHITSAPTNNRLQIWSLLMLIILGDIISAIVSTADIIASNAVKYYRYCQGPRLIMLRMLQHQPQWKMNPKWEFGFRQEVCSQPITERATFHKNGFVKISGFTLLKMLCYAGSSLIYSFPVI